MLIENINYLRKNYRYIRDLLNQFEQQLKEQPIQIEQSKSGLPSLSVLVNGRPLSIHSKYDPLKEAEKLVEQYADGIEKYNHILFYGVGFAYHIEEFMKRYPEKTFSMYEPNPAIFYHYVSNRQLEALPLKQMKNLFVEWNQESGSQFITQFAYELKDDVLLIALPSYSRIFPSDYEQFMLMFKNKIQQKRYSFSADYVFAKRWTLNSLMNLPTTLETPNLLMDKRDVFQNKPVLIVSAGPSLQDEYDNLRQIKENGSAYILAVGSANKALIANDILPDAVCTYDPQEHNYNVFRPMLEENITSVPMIYGTSVGFETIQTYQGPKLHVVTAQDTVSPYFVHYGNEQLDIVDDAFSIAIVTLQLLMKMNAGPIILVGQNFAFRDNQFYSKEIARGEKQTAEVEDKDLVDVMTVKDVYGNEIRTNVSFNQMRLLMEQYLHANPQFEVINTTKGGAAITGATFKPLEEVMSERLKEKVVVEGWFEAETKHSPEQVAQKIRKMEYEIRQFPLKTEAAFTVLREMESLKDTNNPAKLESLFTKFDKAFRQFMNNEFYQVYVRPVSRVHFEQLSKKTNDIKFLQDINQKAEQSIKAFALYLHECRQIYNELSPVALAVFKQVSSVNEKKYISQASGVFHYSGDWQKGSSEAETKLATYNFTNEVGATIRFRFSGTSLRILAGKRSDTSAKIKVVLDGKEETFSTRDAKIEPHYLFSTNSVVYEKNNLTNEMHEVELELLDEHYFVYQGIEIDKEARAYHIHEVTQVEELEVGKRIRCHYKATFNKVGTFSGLGEETQDFIPPESSAYPDGDFYFIMVDEVDGEKKLIADRNVQHSISWNELNARRIATEEGLLINNSESQYKITLPTGGVSPEDKNNDWDRYLVESNLNNTVVPGDERYWNCVDGLTSWCLNKAEQYLERVAIRGKFFGANKWWGENGHYWHAGGSTTNKWPSNGFRPMLKLKLIEEK